MKFEGETNACVLWKILLDPKECCCHVTLVKGGKKSHCPDEKEFLFTAYSVFTVVSVQWSLTPQDKKTPHEITLRAAVDNAKEAEDLPLAPWS